MRFLLKDISIGRWKIPLPAFLWFVLAAIAAIAEISRGNDAINNYHIFAGVFEHTIGLKNLYAPYPSEYIDSNHYGPLFSILIAPFALLPDYLGCFVWCLANAGVLFYAIKQLPFTKEQQHVILLIALVEMMTAIHSVQFNPMLTGWIILSFVLVEKEKDFWAVFFIVAGLFVKIYGIVGIAFFCFSKHKIQFILSFLFWLVVLFCLPMIISSPSFIIQSYKDWMGSLVEKNAQNIDTEAENLMQDISFMGMIRRIFHIKDLKNFFITVPAAFCYALPLLRFSQYKSLHFKLSYLALAMIGVVIFSSSAESSTFVIAVTGIGIWYSIQDANNKKSSHWLLGLVIVLTSLSATDLFPPYVKDNWILPYSLKALPCCILWLVIVVQLFTKKFTTGNQIA
jgi:Glycosyltransferase family 87